MVGLLVCVALERNFADTVVWHFICLKERNMNFKKIIFKKVEFTYNRLVLLNRCIRCIFTYTYYIYRPRVWILVSITYVCHRYFSFVIVHYVTKNIFWAIMAHVIYMRHNCPKYVFSGIMYNDKWEVSMAYVCKLMIIMVCNCLRKHICLKSIVKKINISFFGIEPG